MANYTLRKGDEGQEVKRLQRCLSLVTDGKFGTKTDIAVKSYQQSNSLVLDGIAGPQTLKHLGIEVLHGIDVSAWNGKNIDWKAVSKTNVEYCWIKATEGVTHTNRGHTDKFKGARDNGLIVGGYHFARPDYNNNDNPLTDAVQEAHHFLNVMSKVGIKPGDLLPVLDVEKGMKTDDQYNVDWCLKWLDVVEQEAGVKSVVYSAKWAWDLFLVKANKNDLSKLIQYPVWWASYSGTVEPKRNVRGWQEWNVWQYGSRGSVSGIKGNVDVNWMAGGQLPKLIVP
jgi:GH25 family lysozyme M1 (1,4-beta-N-acetylmuramidase)